MDVNWLSSLFALVTAGYLIVSLLHFCKSKRKGIVFWIDYVLLLLELTVFFILNCFLPQPKGKELEEYNQALYQTAVYSLLIMNSLKVVVYSFGVNSFIEKSTSLLFKKIISEGKRKNEELMTIPLFKHTQKKTHISFIVLVLVLQVICFCLVTNITNKAFDALNFKWFHLGLFGLNFLTMLVMKHFYSKLLVYKYSSINLPQEKLFTDAKEIAVNSIEHILKKNIFDNILNVLFLFYEIKSNNDNDVALNVMSSIICLLTLISYGAYLYTIDGRAKMPKSKLANFFFMKALCSFNLGIPKDNDRLLREINRYHQQPPDPFYLGNSGLLLNTSNVNAPEEKEFLPCNFFIIFKMIFFFFESNKNVYIKVEKFIEEEGIPFRNFSKLNKNQQFSSKNVSEIITRVSRLSINLEMKTSITRTLDEITPNMGDREYKTEFNKYLLKNDTNLPLEFKIETLVSGPLFELFPLYQISIQDVLRSLEINNNPGLFKDFAEMKKTNKHFNAFYTKDSFLSIEIYDSILTENLKIFSPSYYNYLTQRLSNLSYTFLPLIIGIFNLTYLSYNKVIVVSKNPIAFSPSMRFNCWINYAFSDTNAQMRKSAKINEIADIGEIEVRKNISLDKEEYKEIFKILKADMAFLKSLKCELRFYLNLFVLNDEKKNAPPAFNRKRISFNPDNDNDSGDENEVITFNQLNDELRMSDFSSGSQFNYARNTKKYFGSDVVSLLEKLYENKVVENKYVLKFYLSELFRKRKPLFSKIQPSQEQITQDNKQYCKYLKIELKKNLLESESSFFSS